MGLHLCVFGQDEEVEGLDLGHDADFSVFRDAVTELMENGFTGDRFPTLILHPDSFIDRLIRLCDVAIARQSPILFQ